MKDKISIIWHLFLLCIWIPLALFGMATLVTLLHSPDFATIKLVAGAIALTSVIAYLLWPTKDEDSR
jgi:hypothetical protein